MIIYPSEHFTRDELNPLGLEIPQKVHSTMIFCANHLLEPFRYAVNVILDRKEEQDIPVYITTKNGGYRPEPFNTEVGGSKTSMHLVGAAYDVTCQKIDARLARFVFRHLDRNKIVDIQCIWYPDNHFCHIGFAKPGKGTSFHVKHKGIPGCPEFHIENEMSPW